MSSLAEALQARGYQTRTFANAADFVGALPIGIRHQVVEGRLYASRRVGPAEIFVLEYAYRDKIKSITFPVRRLVHVRSPAFAGKALVSPTFLRLLLAGRGPVGRLFFVLLVGMLGIALLPLLLLSRLFGGKDKRGRVKFGGAFDRQFKVIAPDEAAARALLGERLRAALLASGLHVSLDFDDGLTLNATSEPTALEAVDAAPALIEAVQPRSA